MKMLKTKTTAILIALIMILSVAAIFDAQPSVDAHTPPWTKASWTYIAVTPTPIGIGQEALIVFWLDTLPQTASGQYGDRYTFTVTVTKPDNTTENLGPITSDPVGGGWTTYTPNQLGTYTFVAKFPGITYKGANPPPGGYTASYGIYINDTLLASASDPVSIVVQQDPIPEFVGTPLPTDYWTRPIYATNREWATIGGNWLADGKGNPYTTGPETAHIVWAKPFEEGGITGQPYGDISYHTGSAYETMWTGTIIIDGKLYYNEPKAPRYGWYCDDLRTGEQLYYNNGTGPIQIGSQTPAHIGGTEIPWKYPQLSFGQIYDYESPNQHGTHAYLWSTYTQTAATTYTYNRLNGSVYTFTSGAGSTVWQMYDSFTGKWICNIANVPSGTSVVGSDGSELIYTYNQAGGYLTLWNSSKALEFPNNNLGVPYSAYASGEAFYWMWREPIGETINGNNGYSWNITVPKNLGSISSVQADRIIGTSGFRSYGMDAYSIWCLSMKQGQEGTLMWQKSYSKPPVTNTTLTMGPVDANNSIFTVAMKETRQWYGYSTDTGDQVWGPTPSQDQYDMYGMGGTIAEGKLFSYGFAGILHAYDVKTGVPLWNSSTNNVGLETVYPYWPIRSDFLVADGKAYFTTGEHSHTQPLYRGWSGYCVDIETGKCLWNITGLFQGGLIADGYYVNLDMMDNRIYCFGKGQTATTVAAPDTVIPLGSSVVLRGDVTDQSPGAKGTPAISDNDMTAWMEYLYHQRTIPANPKGVEVSLDTIDPNGNYVHIGNTTSDLKGGYGYMWTPEIPGTYQVIATFAGSNSYFTSSADTYMGVGEATPTAAPTPQPLSLESTQMYVLGIGVAIIVVIVIIGALIMLMLRKRP